MATALTFLISFSHSWHGGLYTAIRLLTAMLALQGDPEDDAISDETQSHRSQAIEYFDGIVLNSRPTGIAETATAKQSFLRERIATINLICQLTTDQKQLLELAGRGDVKRLLDRLHKERSEIELIADDEFAEKQTQVQRQAFSLRAALYADSFREGSLFEKTLDQCLTADQAIRFGLFRKARWLGKAVEICSGLNEGPQIVAARLSGAAVGDDLLVGLERLTRLQILLLDSTQITDAGLVHLAGLKRLEELDLSGTRIEGPGLVHLKGLINLKTLILKNTQIRGAAFDNLSELANLTSLSLGGSQITDGEIAFVQNMKQLKILSLRQTRISDTGLAELVALESLRQLDLDSMSVTDAGLPQLTVLKNLRMLDLRNTHVTDTGIQHLAALENLQYLCLLKTEVTPAGVSRLKQSIPQLRADH